MNPNIKAIEKEWIDSFSIFGKLDYKLPILFKD